MNTKKSKKSKWVNITVVPYREMSQLWRDLHKELPNVKEAVEVLKDVNRVIIKHISRVNRQFDEVKKFFGKHEEPYAEISQNHKQFLVNMKLPKVNKKNIFVKVENSRIEIKGMKVQREEGKRKMVGFYRTIELPQNISPEDAKATFKNESLKIKIPKILQSV